MQRIVHFDLKGAPPKVPFFEQVLHGIKSWGATGVLLEWEDTFPYSGNLTHLGSESNVGGDGMYNILEVQHIIALCKEIGLEVIQLVQTIGHMEFVLKHPCHEHLREYDRSPSIICPEKQQSKELVKEMVTQALAVQPDAKYFHIGADEVCHIAYCEDCTKKIKTKYPLDHWRIYLDYIRDLVLFIKQQRPAMTILMWDDMIRAMSPEILGEYSQLSEMVELVVWNYDVQENFRFPPGMWVVYNRYFPKVWAGSAFKGANGSSQLVSPVARYVRNQDAWVNEMRTACSQVEFVGVVFTGWSRYDHFATLCELLPTSLNSLANCLKCFVGGSVESFAELFIDNTLPDSQWPGKPVAESVLKVAIIHEGCLRLVYGDLRTTWLNRWQLDNGFLNLFQVDNIENYLQKLSMDLKVQEKILTKELHLIFGPRACAEWLQTHIGTIEMGLAATRNTIRHARRFDPRSSEYAFSRTPSMDGTVEHLPSTVKTLPSSIGHKPSTVKHLPSTSDYTLSAAEHPFLAIGPSKMETVNSMVECISSSVELGSSNLEHVPPTV